ncbi:MAG: hypothetical protein LC797_11195 [Chloroflexi bacterium]|nr:hypothetical protein [Chloroflexota bacterium]
MIRAIREGIHQNGRSLLRNLVRARADAKADQLRAKHHLSKFLLRQGCWPPVGTKNWSQRHFQSLR